MKYRAEIDGLRALAVVPVILFHAGSKLFSGGFVGVDVFFVISGYLIATILIEDIENKRFSIVNFYERRARRILPALVFMLLLVAFVSWLVLLPNEMRNVYQQLVSNSFFLSNIHYTMTWGYFELWTLPPVLLNSWSLAVEEQFYLIIPLLLFFFKNRKAAAVITILSLTVISILTMIWLANISSKANYYLLPSRFWELAIGVLLAYLMKFRAGYAINFREIAPAWSQTLALILLFIIFISYSDETPYPSIWTIPPVLLTVFTILLINQESLGGRLLANRYFVYIGKISYPLYLFHFPIIILLKTLLEPAFQAWEVAILAVASTVVLSIFTFHCVEYPFRTGKFLKTQVSLLSVSVISLCFIASLGLLGHFKVLDAYSLKRFPELSHLVERVPMPFGVSTSDCAARNSHTQCELIVDESGDDKSRKLLIVGDSFAANLISPLWKVFKDESNMSLSARITLACSYMPGDFSIWAGECGKARSFLDNISSETATDIIFHINFIGHLRHENEIPALESLTQLFRELIEKGIHVHLLGAREVFNIEPTRALLYPWLSSELKIEKESSTLMDFYRKWNEMGVAVYQARSPLNISDAYKYYSDKGHLSYKGSVNFMSRLGVTSAAHLLNYE